MSDYVHEKVLRIPLEKIDLSEVKKRVLEKFPDCEEDWEWKENAEFALPDLFDYRVARKFSFAPTEEAFLDFVLEEDHNSEGDWGRTRDLTPREVAKYRPIFQKIDPNVNMDLVRLVEFCWYNSTEAPDYYSPKDDPFYDEV